MFNMGCGYMSVCDMIFYNFCMFQIFNFLKKSNIRGGEEGGGEEEKATGVMGSFVLPPSYFSNGPLGWGQSGTWPDCSSSRMLPCGQGLLLTTLLLHTSPHHLAPSALTRMFIVPHPLESKLLGSRAFI